MTNTQEKCCVENPLRAIAALFFGFLLGSHGLYSSDTPSGDPLYRLPFPPGLTYRVICGPGDLPYHGSERNRFAYDFTLPLGSEVSAARSGIVVRTESRFDGPTGRSEENNFVALRHSDGQVSEYHHLLQDGVLVRIGETVEAGEIIGFSGASGKAEGAHLHFVVLIAEKSVPVRFEECPKAPVKGDACTSANAPPSLLERYRTLALGAKGSELLLGEGHPEAARILLEALLQDQTTQSSSPAEKRREWALRPLEAELEALKGKLSKGPVFSAIALPRSAPLLFRGQHEKG